MWTWNEVRGLRSSQRLVLLALADEVRTEAQGGDGRTTIIGQEALAAKVELTSRRVREILGQLEQRRLIQRTPRHRQNGSRTSDTIELFGPAFVGQPEEIDRPTGSFQQPTGRKLPDQNLLVEPTSKNLLDARARARESLPIKGNGQVGRTGGTANPPASSLVGRNRRGGNLRRPSFEDELGELLTEEAARQRPERSRC